MGSFFTQEDQSRMTWGNNKIEQGLVAQVPGDVLMRPIILLYMRFKNWK